MIGVPPSASENRVTLLVAVAVLMISMWFVFLTPSQTGDTFMTLAGGRDVVDGKLGQSDDWSFNTDGRVWIDQSWGTGLLFYGLWQQLGYFGLVVYKAVMIGIIALFTVLAARQLKASYAVAILVAAFTLDAASTFINIRANLFGLAMLAPLIWTLYVSDGRPHRIWWVVALLTLWSHMHGSFIFGIAVLGLWAVVQIGVGWWQDRRSGQLNRLWPFPLAALLTLVLAAVTSPLGITNLTQPFTLMGLFVNEPWPLENTEMVPLLGDHPHLTTFPGLSWYLLMLGSLAAPLIARVLGPSHNLPPIASLDNGQRTKWIFTLALASVSIVMAFQARRFVPISLIACAPLLAAELQRLFSHRRYAWPTALVIVVTVCYAIVWQQLGKVIAAVPGDLLAVTPPAVQRKVWLTAMAVIALAPMLCSRLAELRRSQEGGGGRRKADRSRSSHPIARRTPRRGAGAVVSVALAMLLILLVQLQKQLPVSQSDDPLYPTDDLFGRLVMSGTFPDLATQFLVTNNIQGNVLNDWQWEGFLYWHCPQIKVMLGGRSRQIYTPADVRRFQRASGADDRSVYIEMDIKLIITQATEALANRLFSEPDTPWQIIYYDGMALVAALRGDPDTEDLIGRSKANRLVYPSEKSQAYTVAAQRLALSSDSSTAQILSAVSAATSIQPTPQLYQLLLFQQKLQRVNRDDIAKFFEAELDRLHGRDGRQRFGFEQMASRSLMALVVSSYYRTEAPLNKQKIRFWKKYSRQCGAAASAALARDRGDVEISEIPADFGPGIRQFNHP